MHINKTISCLLLLLKFVILQILNSSANTKFLLKL